MKINRIAAIILTVILCLAQVPVYALSSENQKPAELLQALGYLSDRNGRWTVVAQNAAGATPDSEQARVIKDDAQSNLKTGYSKPTDLAYDILALSSCGYDASGLILPLLNRDDMLAQGANGPIYSLLAVDCSGYTVTDSTLWDRDALCDAILTFQTAEGGFRLDDGMDADVDITAYALTALSPYSENKEVADAIARGVNWLMHVQNEDATFSSLGAPTSESTAAVIIALISLGTPVTGQRFSKDGVTVYDALLNFQNADGGFAHRQDGSANLLSTEQAVMAMGAVCFGKSPFRLAVITPPADTSELSLSFVFSTVGIIVLIYLILLLVRKIGDRYASKSARHATAGDEDKAPSVSTQDIDS